MSLFYLSQSEQDSWNIFLSSIFYIGKGTRSRPFQHLYDAIKKFERYNVSSFSRIRMLNKHINVDSIWVCTTILVTIYCRLFTLLCEKYSFVIGHGSCGRRAHLNLENSSLKSAELNFESFCIFKEKK